MGTNHDGVVSPEELAAALAKQKKSPGSDTLSAFGVSGVKSRDIFSSLAIGIYNAVDKAAKNGAGSVSLNATA